MYGESPTARITLISMLKRIVTIGVEVKTSTLHTDHCNDYEDFQNRLKLMYFFEWAVHPSTLLFLGIPLSLTIWWLSSRQKKVQQSPDEDKIYAWFNDRCSALLWDMLWVIYL